MTLVEEIARALASDEMSPVLTQHDWRAKIALSVILQRLREPDEGMVLKMIAAEDSLEASPRTTGNFYSPYYAILRAIADHLEGK